MLLHGPAESAGIQDNNSKEITVVAQGEGQAPKGVQGGAPRPFLEQY